MKKYYLGKITFISIISLFSFVNCTDNPFSDDEIGSSDGHTITGQISLYQNDSKDNVYVWLERLNIGTYTDHTGKFIFQLPLPILQPGNGVSGESLLYYYLGNYQIDSSTVEFLNGKFLYGKKDVNNNGEINREIILKKLASINTTVTPDTIISDSSGYLNVKVNVAPINGSVKIKTFAGSVFDGLLYKHQGDSINKAILIRSSTIFSLIELSGPIQWEMTLNVQDMSLGQGIYEFIPYIEVFQEGIPEYLFDSLGENPGYYTYKYLNLPFKRKDGILTVLILTGS